MIAKLMVFLFAGYGAAGLLFALGFVTVGIGRIDPAAAGSRLGFRLLVLPGAAALWPLLAWRWARGQGPPAERGPHHQRKAGS